MTRDRWFRARHALYRGQPRADAQALARYRQLARLLALALCAWVDVAGVRAQAPSYGPGQECFPACRTGYVCHGGQCVSACNPPCPSGQVCTSEATCVSACNPPCARGERCESDGNCRPERSPRYGGAAVSGQDAPAEPNDYPAPEADGFAPLGSQPVMLAPVYPTYPRRDLRPHEARDGARERGPLGPPNRIWFELSSFVNTQTAENDNAVDLTTVVQTPELHANIGFARHFRVDGVLPFSLAILSPSQGDTGTAFRAGNPSASFQFLLPIGPRGWLSLGIGLALPLASYPDDTRDEDGLAARAAYAFAIAMHGLWNAWNYLPERFSLYLPVEIELGSARVRYAGEMAVGHGFYIGDGAGDDVTIWQIGARIQAYVSRSVSFGARLRTVFDLSSDIQDRAQVSFEPFFDAALGHFLLGFGFVMNLDDPYGPDGDLFVWGTRLSVGAQF